MQEELLLLCPGLREESRCRRVLRYALQDRRVSLLSRLPQNGELRGKRLLFAFSLPEDGITEPFYRLLAQLRRSPDALEGCTAGVLLDSAGALYSKAAAQELVLSANLAGCRFPGRPLVEATGTLQNFAVQAKNGACSLEEAYCRSARELADRILSFAPSPQRKPNIAVLHASNRQTSNTLALWSLVKEGLEPCCRLTEIGLRNGTLEDCRGCAYTACLHYGEQGGCFYGGVMVREVYPAIRSCDAVLLLCPNYNDALSANLTACINRLTALYRTMSFADKALFGIVVSGYSGGDLVARQLLSGLCMNKGFWLPPRFALLETANDAGTAVRLPGIRERTADFARRICSQLCKPLP